MIKPLYLASFASAGVARIEPILTAVSTDVPMPVRASKRGSKSNYDFDTLTAVGASFGVLNKTAANLYSIVLNANKKAMQPKRDDKGAIVFKTSKLTGADGSVTDVPTNDPEMVATKRFFAVDVDPKKDPGKASVRVFREL